MKGIIYKATNQLNGMVYIGQTVAGLPKRKGQHLKDSKTDWRTNYFHFHLHQCSKAFEWVVLDEFKGDDEFVMHSLNVAEEYWIIKYDATNPERGYNSTQGGYSSDVFAEHVRKRLNRRQGAKAFLQYDLDGNFIKEFPSLNAICLEFDRAKLKESELLKPSWRGYMWKRKENGLYPRKIEAYSIGKRPTRKVAKYNFDGDIMSIYEGVPDAKRQNPISAVYEYKDVISIHEKNFSKSILVNFGFIESSEIPRHITIDLKIERPKKKQHQTARLVSAFDLDGVFVKCFDSMGSAMRWSGCNGETIRRSLSEPLPYFISLRSQRKYIFREGKYEPGDKIDVVREERKPKIKHKSHREVYQYSLDGEFIRSFPTVYDASIETGESYGLIRKMCMGGYVRKPMRYIWQYKDGIAERSLEYKKIAIDKVLQYSHNGEFVCGYKSISDAVRATGDSYALIRKLCMGGVIKKATKFQWKYAS